ncbi:hypothetical protein [Reyranella sp.]|uniref:hypothetical protein n=1 Tax=Reyranella sp. TaxID=1929291 RepID=UPI003BAA09F4
MHKFGIAALAGGLFLAPLMAANAQDVNLAYATGEPRSEYMVFLEKGNQVPLSASVLLQPAVVAAQAGQTVHVSGKLDQAQVVKNELIREGAPAHKVLVAREPVEPLPRPADSIASPADRKVDIKF